MTVFFTCITLVGSGIVLFALFLMLAEKRRVHDYRQDAAEKKDDLVQVIEDAELLIEEMNKFSDYVVSNLEEKNNLLNQTISDADYRIETLGGLIGTTSDHHPDQGSNDNLSDSEQGIESIVHSKFFKKGKVIPFDVKRREIIKLSKSGLDSAQIARLLNMGRGEIELIAKMGL